MAEKKLSHLEFLTKAILALRDETKGKGIHVVYSGLNDAWRQYFGTDPRTDIQALRDAKKCVIVPSKKGVRVYLPQDAPTGGESALKKILG